jgi:hypothetical protein
MSVLTITQIDPSILESISSTGINLAITQVSPPIADTLATAGLSLQITQIDPSFGSFVTSAGVDMLLTQTVSMLAAVPAGVTIELALPGSFGGGGGSNLYSNPAYPLLTTTQLALNYLLYVPPTITGFSNSVGTVELGSTVHAVNLAWSFSKAMTSVTINGATVTPTLTSESLTGLNLTTNTSYTLSGSDGTDTVSASTTIGFSPRRWWGSSALPALASSDILGLGNSEFAGSLQQTKSLSATAAYFYFAWPASFGTPSAFTVGGLASSGWVQATVAHTNAAGYTQNYYTFRSQYLQNGTNINIVVS